VCTEKCDGDTENRKVADEICEVDTEKSEGSTEKSEGSTPKCEGGTEKCEGSSFPPIFQYLQQNYFSINY
jgi:hypothetical protein